MRDLCRAPLYRNFSTPRFRLLPHDRRAGLMNRLLTGVFVSAVRRRHGLSQLPATRAANKHAHSAWTVADQSRARLRCP
jgi:hypothetical protein